VELYLVGVIEEFDVIIDDAIAQTPIVLQAVCPRFSA
jgi:hypothetical protein